MKSLTQSILEAYAGQPINSADKKVVKSTGPDGKPMWKKVPAKRDLTKEETELEEKNGLWDNIHAKRKRIESGSGERMRKPGSEGAPTAQNFTDASVKEEAQLDEVSSSTLYKYSIKAAQQGDKRLAGQKMADEKIRKKHGYSSSAKVAAGSVKEEAEDGEYYDEWNEMTRSELKAAINAAKEILDMMDDGIEIERWQLSEITKKASEGLTDVYINLSADNEYDEEDEDEMPQMEEVDLDENVGGLFKNASEWKAQRSRGLIVKSATHPSGEMTKYQIAKDKQGNNRGHFDHGTRTGRLKEEVKQISEISQKLKDRYVQRSMSSHQHMSAVARDSGTPDNVKKEMQRKMKLRNQGMGRAFGQTKDTM